MKNLFNIFLYQLILLIAFNSSSLLAIGTYAEGSVLAKIVQIESRGLVFESFEGLLEISSYAQDEKCDEAKDECFKLTKKQIEFSVRPQNAEVVNLLKKSINAELLIDYKIHRIKSITLSSDFEVLAAKTQETNVAPELGEKLIVKKSGSKRNFSVYGRILQLDYQGTFIGTYEGLYLDETKGRIHPFSVTNEQIAKYALTAMKSSTRFNIGITVAFATGFRKSDYDIFEINYKAPADGVYTPN
ncbi:MAG: hypothetical protein SFU98_22215 [Leptospiraceae bacterium]|nr:hypothetical protein [Leptospiraceae bacterium]